MDNSKIQIGFIGLGAMGSRMAQRLIQAGFIVKVWNRTPSNANELFEMGAFQAISPKDAAANSDFIISMVRDDEASKDVWLNDEYGAIHSMKSNAIAIEMSTLTLNWTKELSDIFKGKRLAFIESPVSGSRPQAQAGSLVLFVAGDKNNFEQSHFVLKNFGNTIHYLGEAGAGALTKLITNSLLGIHVAALSELINLVENSNYKTTDIINAVSTTSVWSPADNYLSSNMINKIFDPQFPLELLAKDINYLSGLTNLENLPMNQALKNTLELGIQKGLGKNNMTGLIRIFTK